MNVRKRFIKEWYWWSEYAPIVLFVLVILAGIAFCVGILAFGEYMKCRELQQVSEHVYNYFVWNGCNVLSPNGFWIDVDSAHLLDWTK